MCIYIFIQWLFAQQHLDLINTAQNPLQVTVRGTRLELRLHMTRLVGLNEHETPLVMLDTHNTLGAVPTCELILIEDLGVLEINQGDVNWLGGTLGETELAIPCHVLDGHESSVGLDDEVIVTVSDENAVGVLDDFRKDTLDRVGGEVTLIFRTAGADEDRFIRAFGPGNVGWGVQCLYDFRALEVDGCTGWQVVQHGGEAKYIPLKWANLVDLVDVPARVDGQRHFQSSIENIAVLAVLHWRLDAGCWESKVFLDILVESARLVDFFERGQLFSIEVHHVVVFGEQWICWHLHLDGVESANDRIVYEGTWIRQC